VYASTDPDFSASDTLVKINATTVVENLREKCGEAGSTIDINAGATVAITLGDGSRLSHNVAIGE
jgi:hypothetical protein